MLEFSIILPTYNEKDNILVLIERIRDDLEGYRFEVIVVDDQSPDGTSDLVSAHLRMFNFLRLITRTEDRSLVQSLNAGIAAAQADICVWMDADLSMLPSDIPAFIAEIRAGADLVVGSRYITGGRHKGAGSTRSLNFIKTWQNLNSGEDSFANVMISQMGNYVVRFILDRRYHDYTSGFYAVRRQVLSTIGLEGKYLDYCITFLYKSIIAGFVVVEVPVTMVPRYRGESKTASSPFQLIPLILDSFKAIGRLRRLDRQEKK